MSNPPLLDLTTLIERPVIAIDGARYEILAPAELSLLDSQRFTNWAEQMEALSKDEEKNDELKEVVDKAARKVLVGVPDDVFEKLSDANKSSVIEAFTLLLLQHRMKAVGATLPEILRTGAKFFPGSSDSSGASPDGGSEKRQPHS